jgi:4-hydroxy-2-oxoheptanedioate aldolase
MKVTALLTGQGITLKDKLKNNEQMFGTWCIIPSAEVANVLIKSGLNFILIDFEHSPVSFETAQKIVMAAHAENKYAVSRVGKLEEVEILRSLDIASDGIIVPHIETLKDVEMAVSYIKYYPDGMRGYSPYTRAGGYCVQNDYAKNANKKILIGIIIENQLGIDNLDEILTNDDLDLVYLGAYDISISIGLAGQINHPKVVEILDKCIEKIKKNGKIIGAMYHTQENYEQFSKQGVNFLVYKVDSLIINEGLEQVRTAKLG